MTWAFDFDELDNFDLKQRVSGQDVQQTAGSDCQGEDSIGYGSDGRPRGLCSKCDHCRGWLPGHKQARASEIQVGMCESAGSARVGHQIQAQNALPSQPASTLLTARGDKLPSLCGELPKFDGTHFHNQTRGQRYHCMPNRVVHNVCLRCGCLEDEHEEVMQRFGRFAESFKPIPLEALNWSEVEIALWGDTGGIFDPRIGSCKPARKEWFDAVVKASVSRSLVSVICPTLTSRRCFHPFLWRNFCEQDYDSKELIVIETGEDGPSPFFHEKQKTDNRLFYRYFRVPENQWSIGLKRNLACYFAAGEVISHFDDDDLYAPCYLSVMVGCLWTPRSALLIRAQCCGFDPREDEHKEIVHNMNWQLDPETNEAAPGESLEGSGPLEQQVLTNKFGAACSKLCSFYTFSPTSMRWGFFDPFASVGEDDASHASLLSQVHGWGFSLTCAWLGRLALFCTSILERTLTS